LSAQENRQAVITTLVSDVATAYLTLRELDYTLEISQRTLQTREQSLVLTRSRQVGGVSTLLNLRQAEQLVYTAAETIPTIQQQIEQTENQIRLLLGGSQAMCRAAATSPNGLFPDVQPVCRRPAATPPRHQAAGRTFRQCQIQVARATCPQFSLTGAIGGTSATPSLLTSPQRTHNLTPQVTVPIHGRCHHPISISPRPNANAH
jgi:multidrug efflux system outer membrane protein